MTAEHFVAPFCATAIRRGALSPANPVTAARAAAAPGPFLERMRELEQALGVRLVPVSQKPVDGIILRTASAPQRVDDAAQARLREVAPLDLAHTRVTSAGIARLAPLKIRQSLSLVKTRVNETAHPALRKLPGLAAIYGFGTRLIGSGKAGAAELR
jgi:hypothetical protein